MNRKERRAAAQAERKSTTVTPPPAAPTQPETETAATPQPIPCQPRLYGICEDVTCPTCTAYLNEPIPEPKAKPEISEARLNANRLNAQSSTGPTSTAGKAKVSTNAVKTALTGRTVLLPFDNVNAYQALLADYQKLFQPVGPVETGLVQSLVDTAWRLERIPALEYALIELTHNKLGHENADVALNTPDATLEMHFRQVHAKDFRNLEIQESRLVRRRDREMKELRALQQTRQAKEAEELQQAAQAALLAEQQGLPFDVATLGFEFSPTRFTTYMARLTPAMKQNLLNEALPKAA